MICKCIFISALLLAIGANAADSDLASRSDSLDSAVVSTNQAAQAELKRIMSDDDDAQAEVDRWIRENEAFAAKGGGIPDAELNRRILDRLRPVRQAYEDFIKRHPNHADGRVAFGSFLGDLNDEDAAREQLEKALTLTTNNPAVYNNLANIYGHTGPVKKAFEYYAKAIALNPKEPVYYHNFGTTVYLFRKDAKEYYKINEDQVFDKAMALYSNALRLDPTNFPLASDVAQSYYGIKPSRFEDALNAWTNALNIAHDEIEREGVYIHLARVKISAGRFDEARTHLQAVTNGMYKELKARIVRNLDQREQEAAGTNANPAEAESKVTPTGPTRTTLSSEDQNKSSPAPGGEK